MIRPATRVLIEILAGLVGVLALAAVVLAWRLSSGPMTLGLLTPYVHAALARMDDRNDVTMGETVLAWDGARHELAVRVLDVRVLDPSGALILALPEIGLDLSLTSLLRGEIAPRRIALIAPEIVASRDELGQFSLGLAGQGGGLVAWIQGLVLNRAKADTNDAATMLDEVRLSDGRLVLDDAISATRWRLSGLMGTFAPTPEGLAIAISGRLDLASEAIAIGARMDWRKGVLAGRVGVQGVRPAALAAEIGALAPLAGIELVVDAQADFALGGDGTFTALEIDARSAGGSIAHAPSGLAAIDVQALELRAHLVAATNRMQITTLNAGLGDGAVLSVAGEVAFAPLGAASLEARVRKLPVAKLMRAWPSTLAADARRWLGANLSAGTIGEARMQFVAAADWKFRNEGHIDFTGASLSYLEGMSPARDVAGRATFDDVAFDIRFDTGRIGALAVTDGRARITGLDTGKERLDLDLGVAGTIAAVLAVADDSRFVLAGRLRDSGIAPEGQIAGRVGVALPLYGRIRAQDVRVRAQAKLKEVAIAELARGYGMSGGSFDLAVSEGQVKLVGAAALNGVAMTLALERTLAAAGLDGRYRIGAHLDAGAHRTLALPAFARPHGPVEMLAEVSAGDLRLDVDLGAATWAVDLLGYSKLAGAPARIVAEIGLGDANTDLRMLDVSATDLVLRTQGVLRAGAIESLRVARFAHGHTDIAAEITRTGGELAIALRGDTLDLAPLLATRGEDGPSPDAVALDLDVARVHLGERVAFSDLKGQARLGGGETIRESALTARLEEGSAVSLRVEAGSGERRLALVADDAGALVKAALGETHLVGGRLDLVGRFADDQPASPFVGRLKVKDFRAQNVPLLARLLSLASLTGPFDLLRGEGIAFKRLEASIEKTGDIVRVSDARAFGNALGITMEGTIDLGRDRADLKGTLIPAYTLNSALGHIPLVGELLVGGKGKGLFAATYRLDGPLDGLEVNVNPVAALAPGFLRGFFNIFGDIDTQPADPHPPVPGGQ